MKFKIGDKVRIIDCSQTFDTYEDFFDEQRISKSKFISGELPRNGQLGDIIHIGQHIWVGYGDLCIVRINEVDYVMEDKGLELVEEASHNLIPQIAKMLGVEIGEEFKISNKPNVYKFTEDRLIGIDGNGTYSTYNTFFALINGKEKIIKLPKKPILTEDEKVILRNLPKEYKWIARDKNTKLYAFVDRPTKHNSFKEWGISNCIRLHFDPLFQFIKWEDEEPYDIEKLWED